MYSKSSRMKAIKKYVHTYCPDCEQYSVCPLRWKCEKMKGYLQGWSDREDLDNDNTNNGDQ